MQSSIWQVIVSVTFHFALSLTSAFMDAGSGTPLLLYGNGHSVRLMDLSTYKYTELASNRLSIIPVAYHFRKNMVSEMFCANQSVLFTAYVTGCLAISL
jgi:hypothetical protein